MSLRVGIVGVTGYTGSETLRWLLAHPEIEVATAVSSTRAGYRAGMSVTVSWRSSLLRPSTPSLLPRGHA